MHTLAGLHNTHNSTQIELSGRQLGYPGWDLAFEALPPAKQDKVVARFWGSVDRSGDCWICRLSSGDYYGHAQFTFRSDGIQYHVSAHRFSWFLEHGATELCVLHGPRARLSAHARLEILAAPSGREACERFAREFGCTEETVPSPRQTASS